MSVSQGAKFLNTVLMVCALAVWKPYLYKENDTAIAARYVYMLQTLRQPKLEHLNGEM